MRIYVGDCVPGDRIPDHHRPTTITRRPRTEPPPPNDRYFAPRDHYRATARVAPTFSPQRTYMKCRGTPGGCPARGRRVFSCLGLRMFFDIIYYSPPIYWVTNMTNQPCASRPGDHHRATAYRTTTAQRPPPGDREGRPYISPNEPT